jgi:hypothetical protein
MKTTIHTLSGLLLGSVLSSAGTSTPSFEQPLAPAAEASPWSCRVGVYGWLQAVEGDVGARGITTPVDFSIPDVLDKLDLALMGVVEVGYGRWSLLADSTYVQLSVNEPTPFGLIAPSFEVNYTQFVGNYVIGYEVMKTDSQKLDVYAGARVNWVELEFDLGPFNRSDDKAWVDPIIGARYHAELGNSFFLRALGDIGGFGVSSDLTWQAMAGFGYRFTEQRSAFLTYRAIGTDYTSGDFVFDVVSHGPMIGVDFKF